ncbi:MAG: biotin--[acetyl-CoA-carboxylase] ligase [Nitrososphaerota archaeon]|nr:biotin--[acetyl-CoA-carboxylase] ligase [Nitrososphaerota archaeon]
MVRWTLVELDTVGSTQGVAREHAARGAPEGTVITARSQTSGTGRLGRSWVSPLGGLYLSFILRPAKVARPELAALVAATAMVEGIRQATGLAPTIRWPNDVTIRARKLGGAIAEAQSSGGEVDQIIVGIGVDCNAPASEMGELQQESTSLASELGRKVKVSDVTRSILDSFSLLYERWKSGEDLRDEWARLVGTIGKEVSIKLKTGENPFSCVAEDIDAEGNLVVSLEGESVAISAEDLEWLRERG